MKKLELSQMEHVTGGRNDADCGWAGVLFVTTLAGGIWSGGIGLLGLPYATRNLFKQCELT